MTTLTDRLNAIRERAERAWREDDAWKFSATCSASQDDVFPLLEAVEAVRGALAYSLEQTTNDEWDKGWDAACKKAISIMEDHLGGGDNE